MQAEFNRVVYRYKPNAHLWEGVARAYAANERYYHTGEHLNHLLAALKPFQHQFSCWDTVVFAIAYHDFCYTVTATDNEEKSAAVARIRLVEIDFPASEIARCEQFILATKKHTPVNPEVDLFTDADLSILGATPERYQQYAADVRKEYAHYPDSVYIPGRKDVLRYFLGMKRIFKTDVFYNRYEQAARTNLEHELHL